MKFFCGLLIAAFTLTSCGTMRINKISDFAPINNVKDLNGSYLNRISGNSILSCFNIKGYTNFVTIVSENPNEIKLIYSTDSTEQEKVFTGQMKKKYFEIYFSKDQFFIPIVFSSIDVDRIRIGKSKDGKLLIREFLDWGGNLLFLGDEHSYETPYKFPHSTEYKDYMPIQKNGLWGYSNSSGEIVIPAKYNFAYIFERGVARVKLNNKWGLINRQGEEITPLKYDKIYLDTLYSPPIFRVLAEEKQGVLDINGKELIPVIFDYIGYPLSSNEIPLSSDKLTPIRLGTGWGFALRTKVVIPAIYSSAVCGFYGEYACAMRDGIFYLVDKDGYEYVAKVGIFTTKPILTTKRKIPSDGQY